MRTGATCGLEQNGAHGREDFPIRVERVQITLRNTAAQVGIVTGEAKSLLLPYLSVMCLMNSMNRT